MFGVARWRHHCRSCGHLFCAACTDKTFLLQSSAERGEATEQRVCGKCYVFLSSDEFKNKQWGGRSQVRERSSVQLCGPHVGISPAMLRSSNKQWGGHSQLQRQKMKVRTTLTMLLLLLLLLLAVLLLLVLLLLLVQLLLLVLTTSLQLSAGQERESRRKQELGERDLLTAKSFVRGLVSADRLPRLPTRTAVHQLPRVMRPSH